jgi:hypothetical protein
MQLHLSTIAKRALGLAFATSMLAGGLASAASPAGDVLDADFSFRDETHKAVIAIYPYSDVQSRLSSFRVRGPKVSWIESHPMNMGGVGWRVIIKTAPTKNGPWTVDRKTKMISIFANDTGKLETFPNRTVDFKDRTGKLYVRLTSRLVWFVEDGNGPIAWAKHTYTKYGIYQSSGIDPDFGDSMPTRSAAPNIYPS